MLEVGKLADWRDDLIAEFVLKSAEERRDHLVPLADCCAEGLRIAVLPIPALVAYVVENSQSLGMVEHLDHQQMAPQEIGHSTFRCVLRFAETAPEPAAESRAEFLLPVWLRRVRRNLDRCGIPAEAEIGFFTSVARQGRESDHVRREHLIAGAAASRWLIAIDVLAGLNQEPAIGIVGIAVLKLTVGTHQFDQLADSRKGKIQRPLAKRSTSAPACNHVADYPNLDATGEPTELVVIWGRLDGENDIRIVRRHEDGWRIVPMQELDRYSLAELALPKQIHVFDDGLLVEANHSTATIAAAETSGSESPENLDWSRLASQSYFEEFDLLTGRNVRVPICPHDEAIDSGEGCPLVEPIAADAEPAQTDGSEAEDGFRPFPTAVMPEPVREFVMAGARAIGCDESYVALPLLTVLAAAIGNTRRIELKRDWTVPATLWAALVGESGTSKTPAFKLAMRFIRRGRRVPLSNTKRPNSSTKGNWSATRGS